MGKLSGILFAVALLTGVWAAGAEERANTPYAAEGSGFSIKYPSKWRKQQGEGGSPAVRFTTADGAAYVDVEVIDMNQNFDFVSFMRLETMSAKKRTDYKEVDNGEVPIAGHRARKFVFSYAEKDVSGVIASYYLYKGKKPSGYVIYKITGVCRSDKYDSGLKETIEDIATSFDFEK